MNMKKFISIEEAMKNANSTTNQQIKLKQNQFGGNYQVDAIGGMNAGYDEATFNNFNTSFL